MPSITILQQVIDEYSKGTSEIAAKVHIQNPDKVEELISRIVDEGPSSLQVVTDFDATLTRYHLNGEICDSTYGVIDRSSLFSPEFKTKSRKSYEKYHPIEINDKLSVNDKIPQMLNWYNESHECMISHGMDKNLIKQMVKESKAILRDNAKVTLETLNKANIPVLVFSAGIGDILEEVLKNHEALLPNMKVVSNYMEFNEKDMLTGFSKPIIHTFNKNESVLGENVSYFLDLSHRGNAIVLGDSTGDSHMADGMHNPGAILKIGFLNLNIDERLDTFQNHFDIVILDDQSMDFVNSLLRFILKETTAAEEN